MKSSQLKNQLLLNEFSKSGVVGKEFASSQLNKIIASFSKEKVLLNRDILEYLEDLVQIKIEQNHLHRVKYEEVIDVKQLITRTKSLNFEYANFLNDTIDRDGPFNSCFGGVFDINIDKLIAQISDSSEISEVERLYYKNIDLKYNNKNNMKLSIYANGTTASDESFSNQDLGWNAGVRFQMPLYETTGDLPTLEKRVAHLKIQKDYKQRGDYVRRLYYEYKYKVDDLIKLYYKYERGRYQLKRLMIGYNSGFTLRIDDLSDKIKELLLIDFQILEVRQQLYTKAAMIFGSSQVNFKYDYIKPLDLNVKENLLNERRTRSLYIWANGFKQFDNYLLSEMLNKNNYKDLIISVSKNQDFDKFDSFLGEAYRKDMRVQMLLSNNNWAKNPYSEDVLYTMFKLQKYSLDIHLDIEFHTFSDWKSNKDKYYSNYLKLLSILSEVKKPDSLINISIPLHYDVKELIKMQKYVSKFYVMAYGIKDVVKMKRRISKYMDVKDQLVVMLNIKDFKSILELELFISNLKKDPFFKNMSFGAHNLKTMVGAGI